MNILSKKQVECLFFHLDSFESFPINIEGHKHIKCEGMVHNMECTMEDYSLIDVSSVDVIFYIQVGLTPLVS